MAELPDAAANAPAASVGNKPPAAKPVPPAVHAAAQEFEAFFLSQAMQSMFAGVETNSLFGGGQSESVYRSLLLQEYGKVAARSGGLGIADAVQRQILKTQEVKSP
ncbi:MAG TPA: rod-binding protein [Stellaceae bacterium]|nr:rod-binding protein [Stellaceae bacterium]